MNDGPRPLPAWLARLWPRGENHQRLMRLLDALDPRDARAVMAFLRDHELFYRTSGAFGRPRRPA